MATYSAVCSLQSPTLVRSTSRADGRLTVGFFSSIPLTCRVSRSALRRVSVTPTTAASAAARMAGSSLSMNGSCCRYRATSGSAGSALGLLGRFPGRQEAERALFTDDLAGIGDPRGGAQSGERHLDLEGGNRAVGAAANRLADDLHGAGSIDVHDFALADVDRDRLVA